MNDSQRAFFLADAHARELLAAGVSACLVAVVLPSGRCFVTHGRRPEGAATLEQLQYVATLVAEQARDGFPGCLMS